MGFEGGAAPIDQKKIEWKRLFVRAAGFGAGFAAVLCAILGFGSWYASRPKPPKPWNTGVLKAHFRDVRTSADGHFIFTYVIENTSDVDYRVDSDAGINLTIRHGGTLAMCERCLSLLTLPVYIPAKRKMLVPIKFNYTVPPELESQVKEAKQDAESGIVAEYVRTKFKGFDGFILYDDNNRFEIDFPRGWEKPAQAPAN